MTEHAPTPFGTLRIRTGALVFCGERIALLRRERPASVHYTPPGGNVEAGEDLLDALARELEEELALTPGHHTTPQLLWVVDQRVNRPGPTPPPRKLHLIYRLHITEGVRSRLATEEYDEQPDGSTETGFVEWIDYRRAASLSIFPPIGPALAALPHPDAPVLDAGLPAVTDRNYTWV
ncbi:NUDIX domain-containing protein [Streptacidiphilus rugosus]|uniref:NUDIX domain-containing protein n=1 Tax=Streptacidiphilus rugosus TaxID=405783 RepID=UPI00056D89CA|nr:NUDIX domain-containing protein [Streptacidiphilus rugosus]